MSTNVGEEPGHVLFRVLVGELRALVQVEDLLPPPLPPILPPSVTIPNSESSAEKWYGYQVEHEESDASERYPWIRRLEWLLDAGYHPASQTASIEQAVTALPARPARVTNVSEMSRNIPVALCSV